MDESQDSDYPKLYFQTERHNEFVRSTLSISDSFGLNHSIDERKGLFKQSSHLSPKTKFVPRKRGGSKRNTSNKRGLTDKPVPESEFLTLEEEDTLFNNI